MSNTKYLKLWNEHENMSRVSMCALDTLGERFVPIRRMCVPCTETLHLCVGNYLLRCGQCTKQI